MSSDRRTVLRGIGSGTALLVGGVGASSATGRGRGGSGSDSDDRADGEAGLRVAHASPDAPEVDVLVDGAPAVTGLAFREVTDYLEVPEGEYELAVNVAGTDTTVFGPAAVELAAEDYTAVALGEVSSDDTGFTVPVFEDTNGANLDDDEARIRTVHASPDAPAVDVTVNDAALTLFEEVTFGTSGGYTVVPAGSYDVEIRGSASGGEVFGTELTVEGGSTYTAFAEGYLSPDDEPTEEAFGLVATLDKGAPPRGD